MKTFYEKNEMHHIFKTLSVIVPFLNESVFIYSLNPKETGSRYESWPIYRTK